MNDQQASVTLEAVLELAVVVRDEGPDAVLAAVERVRQACAGDLIAALVVAATLVDVEAPVNPWWQQGLAGVDPEPVRVREIQPCGTHAAYVRHRAAGEDACPACVAGETEYQRGRRAARRRETPHRHLSVAS